MTKRPLAPNLSPANRVPTSRLRPMRQLTYPPWPKDVPKAASSTMAQEISSNSRCWTCMFCWSCFKGWVWFLGKIMSSYSSSSRWRSYFFENHSHFLLKRYGSCIFAVEILRHLSFQTLTYHNILAGWSSQLDCHCGTAALSSYHLVKFLVRGPQTVI